MKSYKVWLLKALHDLKSAEKLIEGDEPITDTAIYHTQQSAEEALKAFLAYNTIPLEQLHDLKLLLECCIAVDPEFEVLCVEGFKLKRYSTASRNPKSIIEPERSEVEKAIIMAEDILMFVAEKTGASDILVQE